MGVKLSYSWKSRACKGLAFFFKTVFGKSAQTRSERFALAAMENPITDIQCLSGALVSSHHPSHLWPNDHGSKQAPTTPGENSLNMVWKNDQLIPKFGKPEETWESYDPLSTRSPHENLSRNGVSAGTVAFSPVSPTPIMMTMIMYIKD